jgi:hypothetical protein
MPENTGFMKKYITTFLLLLTLIVTACAHQRKAMKRTKKPVKNSAAGITSVTMARGACFGRCPVYTLTIHSDGMVQYKGEAFTDYIGVYEKKLAPQQATAMLARFRELRVDTCSSQYEQLIADLPGLSYKITMGGKVKEINNAGFGPPFLKALAREMDEMAPIDKTWKKISSDVPE